MPERKTPNNLDEFLAILPPLVAEPEYDGEGIYSGEDIPISAEGGALMATVHHPLKISVCLDPDEDEEIQYDRETLWFAALVSASPELYAVANTVKRQILEEGGWDFEMHPHGINISLTREEALAFFAALAKARGEEPTP